MITLFDCDSPDLVDKSARFLGYRPTDPVAAWNALLHGQPFTDGDQVAWCSDSEFMLGNMSEWEEDEYFRHQRYLLDMLDAGLDTE